MDTELIPTDDPRLYDMNGHAPSRYSNWGTHDYVVDQIVRIKIVRAREELERLAKARGLKPYRTWGLNEIDFKIPGVKWGFGVTFAGRHKGKGSRHYAPERTTVIQCTVGDSYGQKKVFPEGKNGLSFDKILDEIELKVGWAAQDAKRRKKENTSREAESEVRAEVAESMNLSYEHQIGDTTGEGTIKLTLKIPLDVYPEVIAFLEERDLLGKLYRKEKSA